MSPVKRQMTMIDNIVDLTQKTLRYGLYAGCLAIMSHFFASSISVLPSTACLENRKQQSAVAGVVSYSKMKCRIC